MWTPDLAWAVGLITTDGNLSRDRCDFLEGRRPARYGAPMPRLAEFDHAVHQ
jgi:hypothetical protein